MLSNPIENYTLKNTSLMLKYTEKEVDFMKQITIKSYEAKKSIVPPLVFLVVGILLLSNPGGIVEFISYIIGGVFLALGVGKYVLDRNRADKTTGDTFYSVLMVVLGIIFIFFSSTIEFIIRLSIGLWILINALSNIISGIEVMKYDKKGVFTLVIGLILFGMSLYTIFVSNLVLQSMGLVLTIYSVLELINYIYVAIKNK